jgi:regulator of protease activity HflC (stomatin/prohibitin superfamily)
MKNVLKIFVALMLVAFLAACGERVEVPPATVGKIMTKDGYQEGVIPTSKFRLPWCWSYCDNLVLLDVSDKTKREPLTVFIPEDKLNVDVGVQVTLSLATNEVEPLFNSIRSEGTDNSRVSLISWDQIYNTYAQQIILTETREYLSQYSIAEIASSLEKVNSDLRKALEARLQERTPFTVRYVGITHIKYPDIIVKAQENAAERRERIQQEEAQLEISQVELQRQLKEAQLQRQIDVEKAEAEAHAQRIQREVVDDRVLELRRLQNEAEWIKKWNGRVPTTMITSGENDGNNLLLQIPQEK